MKSLQYMVDQTLTLDQLHAHTSQENAKEIFLNSQKLKNILNFFADILKQKYEKLRTRVRQELIIIDKLFKTKSFVLLKSSPAVDLENFQKSFNKAIFLSDQEVAVLKEMTCNINFNEGYNDSIGWMGDVGIFFQCSFIKYLLSHLAAQTNHEHVKSSFTKQGFKNVEINLKQSPYNKRKNVWIIEGAYS